MAKIKFVPWLDENAELTSTSRFFRLLRKNIETVRFKLFMNST